MLQPAFDVPDGKGTDPALDVALKYRDLAETPAVGTAADVQHDLYGGRELTVQRRSVQAIESGKRLQSGWHLGWAIGVHGAGTAIVTCVKGR